MCADHKLRSKVWDSGDKLGVCCSREPHAATTTADTAATAAAGDKLALEITRDDKDETVKLKLGKR